MSQPSKSNEEIVDSIIDAECVLSLGDYKRYLLKILEAKSAETKKAVEKVVSKLPELIAEEAEVGMWFGGIYGGRVDCPVEMLQTTLRKALATHPEVNSK